VRAPSVVIATLWASPRGADTRSVTDARDA
jgi:hypothetical protein